MVLLHVKQSEESQFIVETQTSESVDAVTRRVVFLNNERLRLLRLARAAEELALHGPASAPGATAYYGTAHDNGEGAAADAQDDEEASAARPARTGQAPSADMAALLQRAVSEARACVAKAQAERRIVLLEEHLREAFDRIKGCVMIAYPEGLPEHDDVRTALDGTEVLDGTRDARFVHDPETAVLWWSKKKLPRASTLSDHIGRNEKQKLLIKLQRAEQGQPVSEPALGEEERKNLMAYYYKKQQQEKEMAEDDDDSYANSEWANPRALKQTLLGGKIRL